MQGNEVTERTSAEHAGDKDKHRAPEGCLQRNIRKDELLLVSKLQMGE